MGVYHDKNSLSQNFIKFSSLVKELLDASDIKSSDQVIEVGPGKGIITAELSRSAEKVIAVEKDKSLADNLISEFKNIPNVKIVNQDFLKFYLPFTPYKVFSNIPFSITSEIVAKFLKSQNQPQSMYFIMQQEAAEKFIGFPHETQSSILAKPWYQIKILGNIDRSNFTQKPQVKIIFIEFIKREKSFVSLDDIQDFRDFIIYGFNQWQPTIIDAYKKIFSYNQIKIARKTIKLNNSKPSETSFDAWLGLYKMYKKFVGQDQKKLVHGSERKFQKNIK